MTHVIHAFGDSPMAQAAQIHEAAGRGVRQCCEEHAQADVVAAVEEIRERARAAFEREREVEHVPPETMAMVLR